MTTQSAQSAHFAAYAAAQRERLSDPRLDLDTIRDIVESMHVAAKEPEGVSYAEQEIDGRQALWCIPDGASSDHVLLHSHMGGAVVGSMSAERKAAAHIAKAAGVRSLVLDYRLAPEHKFPAQLDDVESAYRWLLETGYQAHHIASVGVSIGGNLAISLALRLQAHAIPLPAAILAVSPWLDITLSSRTVDSHSDSDKFLTRAFLELFRSLWLDTTGIAWDDMRVNPLKADLSRLPPTAVYYGADELLAEEALQFARLAEDAGVPVQLESVPHGQHAFVLGAGRIPEVDRAVASMASWLRSTLSPSVPTMRRSTHPSEEPLQ